MSIYIGDEAPEVMSNFDLGYLVGFLEGEGGFYLVKDKESKQRAPLVSIYNTDPSALLFIQKTLETYGIKSDIYHFDPKPDKRYENPGPRKRCYRLAVVYRQNCLPLMRLLDGKIVSAYKQQQFAEWKANMVARESEITSTTAKRPARRCRATFREPRGT